MKVLLTGGNGFVGQHLATALQSAGHELVIVSRTHGFDMNHMLSPADWHPLLEGVDVVINSVGIIAETASQHFRTLHEQAPIALFHACKEVGVARVVQISALGADENAFSAYQLTKKAADDVLRHLPLKWFILRPSLVYGDGGKSTALFRRLANLPVIPLAGNGQELIQPVHIDDLVATVMRCLEVEPAGRTLDVVGPEAMTLVEWLQRLRQQDGHARGMTVAMPFDFMLLVASVARYLVPMMHPDNLRMMKQGNTSDVQPLIDFLGRPPRDLP